MTESDTPLRLLWLTENYHPSRGGMAQSCDRIVHGLRELGVPVDVVHFTRHLAAPRVESKRMGRYIGFPLDDDPSHGLNSLWNLLEVDPHRDGLTHVVAFGGVLPLLAGPVYAAWLGRPLVTLMRGNDFDAGIFTPKRADIVANAIARSARICCVSRDKVMKIRALHPDADAVWTPNGIDLAEWEPLPSDARRASEWRREHVAPGRRVLGMIGQIKRKKGGLFFLDALLASGGAERFHLLCVGDFDEEITAWLVANEGIVHHSIFPFADRYELLAHYAACDLAVIPSFYDGLPNVLLEAAGLGIPFIASTAGGMGDLLIGGEHGFLFHPGDVHGCRRSIADAASASDASLRAMGDACRAMVAGEYTATIEAERYRDILLETVRPVSAATVNGIVASSGVGLRDVVGR